MMKNGSKYDLNHFWIQLALVSMLLGTFEVSNAQTNNQDSLINLLKTLPASKQRVDVLNELTSIIVYAQPGSTIAYSQEAVDIAEAIDYPEGLTLAYNRLATGYWSRGALNQAYDHFNISLELARNLKDEYLIALNVLGIGNIYFMLDNFRAANSYYEEAMITFRKEKNLQREAIIHNNIGRSYFKLYQQDSAIEAFQKAIDIAYNRFDMLIPILQFNIAEAYFQDQQYQIAQDSLLVCYANALRNNDLRALIRSHQLMAEIFLVSDNLAGADSTSQMAISLVANTGVKELQQFTYQTRANVCAALKQYDSAFFYQTKASLYEDSIKIQEINRKIDFFEYSKKNIEINLLKKEKINSQLQTSVLVLVMLIFLVFFILLSYLYNYRTRINKVLSIRNNEIYHQLGEITELNKSKDRFFSIISHDVKSPVNQLVALSNILKSEIEKDKNKDEILQMAGMLHTSALRASELIEDLLSWSRSQTGRIPYEPQSISLQALAEYNLELIRPRAEQKGICVQLAAEEDFTVWVDTHMTNTVIRNLLDNALKFIIKGTITIQISKYYSDMAQLSVIDTGQGIKEEYLKGLFKIDSRHTTLGTGGEKGTGLGLVLCREFVEKQGGKIWVTSTYGEGSNFSFTLPIAQKEGVSE